MPYDNINRHEKEIYAMKQITAKRLSTVILYAGLPLIILTLIYIVLSANAMGESIIDYPSAAARCRAMLEHALMSGVLLFGGANAALLI